ncbi:hypothetical protein BDF20DRAFT_872764 [Mycotypha africana]|uniref:uncharacterized protein n=1 Tax=Mycotypha africana TaxID=64632 RepID=UPI0023012F6B|nr:uncharacterized protein BDF20DRAFT_872764 [Mycotypha africana]KAI8977068.1 hypothetical protein BDF20DRAFT_872764 [Mycotypha africana]
MFEPTIKYRKVTAVNDNDDDDDDDKDKERLNGTGAPLDKKADVSSSNSSGDTNTDKKTETTTTVTSKDEKIEDYSFTFEEEGEEKETKIAIDPNDKDRIIVTLSTGQQYSADRYCPHAGADLSLHGKVSEHEYPPEIGPVLMCAIHYWEFALEKEGRGAGGGGWATLNACPLNKMTRSGPHCENNGGCKSSRNLDW